MKFLNRILVLCLFLIPFVITSKVFAQSVNITVNIVLPYSPFYSDYAGPNASKVFLTIQNLTNTTKTIKLTGQLEGDNGIRISTKSTYVPLQPIVLNPNQIKQLNGVALKDIFDLNSLNVYGIDKVKLVQTSRLPEGNYSFCVQAVDMTNNQVISSAAPLGCTTISITYPDAPILISPIANYSVFATTPQSVVFNWINPSFAPIGTQYVLQVAEMPITSNNPNQVLNSVSFPLVNRTLNGFSYILSPADPPLVIGKTYAWRVKALDPTGRIIFKNGGVSQANIFTYTNPIELGTSPTLISPQQNANITSIDNGTLFKWAAAGGSVTKTGYLLQVIEMPSSGGNAEQLFAANKFIINQNVSDLNYLLPSTSTALIPGKRYAWRVSNVALFSKSMGKAGGVSAVNIFTYNPKINAEVPVLINPIANAKLTITSPQNVYFSWQDLNRTLGNIKYNFQVVELINPSSDPSQAFNGGNYFINKNVAQNSYNITNIDPLLKAGKKYAWRIRAYDETGKILFKNNGNSQISVFEYNNLGDGEVLPLAPVITAPKIAEVINQSTDFKQPNININWIPTNTPYAATYQIRIAKLIPGFDAQTAFDNDVQIVLSYYKTGKDFVLSPPGVNEDLNTAKNAGRIKLDEDADYAVQIIANSHGPGGSVIRIANFGKSNVVQFKYKGAPKAPTTEAPTPITSTIAGKFFYRFKAANEVSTHRALGFPAVKAMQYFATENGKTVIKYADVADNNNFPEFFENNTFVVGSDIHPLKNVKISFRYVIFKSASKNPSNVNQLDFIFKKYLENANVSVKINGEQIKYNQTIFTTDLKEDGSFSHTFVNNLKLGFIGTESGVSYFGAIKPYIINDERYYTSPDVFIVPKVGKTVTLPDDIVFVRTYNLNVKVASDKNIKNQAVDPGKPLANYPVQLLDQPRYFGKLNDGASKPTIINDENDNPATMPWEANAESYVGQTLYNLDPNSPAKDLQIADITKTDANGVAAFKNLLVSHTHSPYVAVNPFDGNYNYAPKFGDLIKAGTAGSGNTFTSDFSPETIATNIDVKPKLPEIYLRAVVIQAGVPKGIANAKVYVATYTAEQVFIKDEYFNTDINGYLQLTNLEENRSRTITIIKDGFANKNVATKQNIKLGERFPAGVEQEMIAGGKIAGYIVNEKGEPISCNVRVGDGPYIKNTNGAFQIQNVQSGWKTIEIAPTVDNYYGEFLAPTINANGDWTVITNAAGVKTGRIILKEKLHRVRFKVVDEDGKPVRSDIGVGSNTLSYYINDPYNGLTDDIAFASPGTEFKVRIVANGYVAYDDYVEIPISRDSKIIPITLRKAQIITGTVKDAITGAPIVGARVYTVSGTNADGEVQNSTLTGADGKYTLYGAINPQIWLSYFQFYQPLPIKVYAVKSGTPSYVRAEVETSPGNSATDFSLTPLNSKAEIWGLPIEVHSLAKPNYYTSVITGAFIKLPANAAFKTEFSDTKLPFKQIAVLTSANGFEPVVTAIDVETTALKVMAYEKYGCELIGSDKENVYTKLAIKKTDGYGALTGYLTSELSSFNFSYKYNGKFLVGNYYRLGGGGGNVNTPTKVFSAMPNFKAEDRYGLQPLYGKNGFSIHNFYAKMMGGSKFSSTGYKILADVNLNIPLLGVQSISAGTLNVSQNNIEWEQYTGNVSMPLESWKITGTGLMYDINQGGFKVINGALVTDLPQVSLKDLLIMPTSVDLGLTKFTGKENLTLANVTPLKLVPDAKMTLNYDPAAPFDQKPHYRLNLSGPSKSVAYIDDLPGMGTSKVNINMLSTYSDGKHKTIIVEPTKVNYYNVIAQDVTGIDVANDFFTLVGNTNLEIPGAPNNVTGRFKFIKNPFDPNADKNANVLYIDKLQTDVEMEGKVKFEGTSYKISQNLLSVDGNVLIYKNSLNDAIKGIRGQLTKTPSEIKMNFLPNQKIMMGSNKSINIIEGGNIVQAKKWSLVNFVGQPNVVNPGEKDIFLPNQNLLDFEVNGAMKNLKAGKKIQLSGVETPFGDLEITFDFDKAIFNGTLVLKSANIILGPVTVNDGTIDLQIDKNGFLIVGAVTNASITAPLPDFLIGGFKSGIAMGYYKAALPQHLTKKLLDVTLYNQLPPSFNSGLIGFYVNVMKSLDKSVLPKLPGPNLKDIPLIGTFVPVFDFSAGIDIYTMVDFSAGVRIGGMAFANASCLYDLELCTIGLSGGALGKFDLKFPGKTLEGTLLFGIDAKLNYCLGSLGVGAQLLLEKNGSGFSFKPSLK